MSAFGTGTQFEPLQRRESASSPIQKWSFAITRKCSNASAKIISRSAARKAAVHTERSVICDIYFRSADFSAGRCCSEIYHCSTTISWGLTRRRSMFSRKRPFKPSRNCKTQTGRSLRRFRMSDMRTNQTDALAACVVVPITGNPPRLTHIQASKTSPI